MLKRICLESKPAPVIVNIFLIILVSVNLYVYSKDNTVINSPHPLPIQEKHSRNNRKVNEMKDKDYPKNSENKTKTYKVTTNSSDNDYKLLENSTFDFEAWKNVQATRRSSFIEEE